MKFAIINDMHLSAPETGYENGIQRKLVGDSERLIKKFVNDMNVYEEPEFVVNLGDTIEDVKDLEGDTFYFKKAIKLLSGLKMPAYFLIGNHDVKTNDSNTIAKMLGYEKMYYSIDNSGYHFVATSFEHVDSETPGEVDRIMTEEELEWLSQDLELTNKSTVVFTHYGLADDDMKGNFWFEKSPHKAVLKNQADIRKVLEKSGKVKAVISAHQHWNRMFVHEGIAYFTVTSLVENTNNDGVPAEAYTIVNLDDNKIVVDVNGNDPAHFEHSFINN